MCMSSFPYMLIDWAITNAQLFQKQQSMKIGKSWQDSIVLSLCCHLGKNQTSVCMEPETVNSVLFGHFNRYNLNRFLMGQLIQTKYDLS